MKKKPQNPFNAPGSWAHLHIIVFIEITSLHCNELWSLEKDERGGRITSLVSSSFAFMVLVSSIFILFYETYVIILQLRVREHLSTDRASHIHKHLQASESCRNLCTKNNFKILNSASTYQLKIKEALHILWEKPSLNKQVFHVNLGLFT